MLNVKKIKARMVEKGYTQQKLADEMNVDVSTVNRKINNCKGNKITVEDAALLIELLEIDNPTEYFFA